MERRDALMAVYNAAFGPDSAFGLLYQSGPFVPLLHRVEQVVVDHPSFNAFAEQNLETDTIGIFTGTLPIIYETIDKIGGALPKRRSGADFRAELWWDELDDAEIRYRLCRLCLDFIVFHELSHIALNHCLINSTGSQPVRFFETQGTQSERVVGITVAAQHAFETFADVLAVSLLSSALLRLGTLHERFVFRHPAASISGMVWAMQIVWAILAASSEDYITEQKAFLSAVREGRGTILQSRFTHPHPSLRRAVAGRAISVPRSHRLLGLGAGVQYSDAKDAIDRFLVPDRPQEAREISVLANSVEVIRRFRQLCNTAWGPFRDRLLPFSRFQSGIFVRNLMRRYGWDRDFKLAFGAGARSRVLEEVSSPPPTAFVAINNGRVPHRHWAYKV